jgi:hypothetical protein
MHPSAWMLAITLFFSLFFAEGIVGSPRHQQEVQTEQISYTGVDSKRCFSFSSFRRNVVKTFHFSFSDQVIHLLQQVKISIQTQFFENRKIAIIQKKLQLLMIRHTHQILYSDLLHSA